MRQPVSHRPHPLWHIPAADGDAAPAAVPSATMAMGIVVAVSVAVFAPWLAHVAPVAGLGPVLLPLFYAPLLAALVLRLPMAVAAGIATPILARLLTGMPADPVLPGMVLQIALFVVAIRLFRSYHWLLVAPTAYLASLLVTALATAGVPAVTAVNVATTLQTGWLGVVVLAGLGYIADKTLR